MRYCVSSLFPEFTCQSGQCISLVNMCDKKIHCLDGSDEGSMCTAHLTREPFSLTLPAVLNMDGFGESNGENFILCS